MEKVIAGIRPLADTIWTNLVPLRAEYECPRILFVGTESGAGTTVVSAATAIGLARHLRTEVVLAETTLQRPALADYLGIASTPGLSDVLDRRARLTQAIQHHPGHPQLVVITAGSPRPSVPGEFAAQDGRELLREISSSGSFVIFDAPPLHTHPETRLLLEHIDGVVLVVRARSSRKAEVEETLKILQASGKRVIGSVLNRFRSDMPFSAA